MFKKLLFEQATFLIYFFFYIFLHILKVKKFLDLQ